MILCFSNDNPSKENPFLCQDVIYEGNGRKSYAFCDNIPLLPQAVTALWHVLLSAVGLGFV